MRKGSGRGKNSSYILKNYKFGFILKFDQNHIAGLRASKKGGGESGGG